MVGTVSEASPEACRLERENHKFLTHSTPRQNDIHAK